jgi:hypothetical protein
LNWCLYATFEKGIYLGRKTNNPPSRLLEERGLFAARL